MANTGKHTLCDSEITNQLRKYKKPFCRNNGITTINAAQKRRGLTPEIIIVSNDENDEQNVTFNALKHFSNHLLFTLNCGTRPLFP